MCARTLTYRGRERFRWWWYVCVFGGGRGGRFSPHHIITDSIPSYPIPSCRVASRCVARSEMAWAARREAKLEAREADEAREIANRMVGVFASAKVSSVSSSGP